MLAATGINFMEDVIEHCNSAIHNQVMSDKEVEVRQAEDCLVTLLKKVSSGEVILHLIFSNSWVAYRIGSCPSSSHLSQSYVSTLKRHLRRSHWAIKTQISSETSLGWKIESLFLL